MPDHGLPTIDHTGFLEDLPSLPRYLVDGAVPAGPAGTEAGATGRYSCAFCGVGDSAVIEVERTGSVSASPPPAEEPPAPREGTFSVDFGGRKVECPARLSGARLEVESPMPIAARDSAVVGRLTLAGGATTGAEAGATTLIAQEISTEVRSGKVFQVFAVSLPTVTGARSVIRGHAPTSSCVKLKISTGQQAPVFPIHLAPSVLEREPVERTGGDARPTSSRPTNSRRTISYPEAIARLADLLLAHRPIPGGGRTLVYACGQIDYFTIFAFQEVFRLLGVRNLAGNAEHCLNAGAVHNEILTGQEGPFLTIEQALKRGNLFLLNGWNGLITHPPVFHSLMKRPDFDGYLVEVALTESAQALRLKLGPERVLLIRSGADPHLALAVAHEILMHYPQAVDGRFIDSYADRKTFEEYKQLASSPQFSSKTVAERIAPEPSCVENLVHGIRSIGAKLARAETVPINLPSVGLSQTKGAVAHCLWGSLLGLIGKYGLRADGTPAGGTLRIPGQINAQSEVQGLSRNGFMGRIRATEEGAREAALRMGLPPGAYEMALRDTPRAALDYSDDADVPELFVCFGTQFESNMMERRRWVRKLSGGKVTLVAVDPIPDPFTLSHADLVIPSPPHAAAAKLYQNGEWRLTLSAPRKKAAPQTRTDATIVYDAMAEISRRLRSDPALRAAHPDLAAHSQSGYLSARYESPPAGGLVRIDGEVSRPQLWARVIEYMSGGCGPLYCRPEHADGRAIGWDELVEKGSLVYGGVGTTRYRLDYGDPAHAPFRDIFRQPRKFAFFVPTEKDLALPEGVILNSGRSTLSDDRARIRFAIATFNSGKATPAVDMPAENPLHVSLQLGHDLGLKSGDLARVTNVETGESLDFPVVVTDRLKGGGAYVSFHKSRAEIERGQYLNHITGHAGRCPYTSQTNFKSTRVRIERIGPAEPKGETAGRKESRIVWESPYLPPLRERETPESRKET